MQMKYNFYILAALCFLMFSCKDDEGAQLAATKRIEMKNDSILKVVSNNWNFEVPPLSAKVSERINNWNEWAQLTAEMEQRPTGTITAYRQKAENIINKIQQVKTTIPPFFNKPQLRSRISVLDTKAKALHTYIALDVVQCDKVIALIKDMAKETADIQRQMDEMIRFSEVPKEAGEAEMLRARDTTRLANPEMMAQPTVAPPNQSAPPVNTNIPNRNRQPFNNNKLKPAN
tara:strand:- start:20863 stop:21555 length:693 start_codon:yes stop_codon:yes gene_type:complete